MDPLAIIKIRKKLIPNNYFSKNVFVKIVWLSHLYFVSLSIIKTTIMDTLEKLKKQLTQSGLNLINITINNESELKTDVISMVDHITRQLMSLRDIDNIRTLLNNLHQDEYAVLGYCSDGENDLFEDASKKLLIQKTHIMKKVKTTDFEIEVFGYLNQLLASTTVCGIDGIPHLQKQFDIDKREAKRLLALWVDNFDPDGYYTSVNYDPKYHTEDQIIES